MSRDALVTRAYGALLWLYPRQFREESPLGYLALSLAGIGLMIVGGSEIVAVVIGFAVAVLAAVLAVIAWRRSAPASEPATVTASWWKFVVAGPVLFALVILGAGIGINAWFLGILAVLSGVVSIATGLVLGMLHLGHRIRSNPA